MAPNGNSSATSMNIITIADDINTEKYEWLKSKVTHAINTGMAEDQVGALW